jgi:hypothetical protein
MTSSSYNLCGVGALWIFKLIAMPISSGIMGMYSSGLSFTGSLALVNNATVSTTLVSCQASVIPPCNFIILGGVHMMHSVIRAPASRLSSQILNTLVVCAYSMYLLSTVLSANYAAIGTASCLLLINNGIMYAVVASSNFYHMNTPSGTCVGCLIVLTFTLLLAFGLGIFWYSIVKCLQSMLSLTFFVDVLIIMLHIISWIFIFCISVSLGATSQQRSESVNNGGILWHSWQAVTFGII